MLSIDRAWQLLIRASLKPFVQSKPAASIPPNHVRSCDYVGISPQGDHHPSTQRSLHWLQNGGSPVFNQLFSRAVETEQSNEEAEFSRDGQAQQDAAVTTLINNKAELQLEALMQNNMDLQEGCREALEVSGFM